MMRRNSIWRPYTLKSIGILNEVDFIGISASLRMNLNRLIREELVCPTQWHSFRPSGFNYRFIFRKLREYHSWEPPQACRVGVLLPEEAESAGFCFTVDVCIAWAAVFWTVASEADNYSNFSECFWGIKFQEWGYWTAPRSKTVAVEMWWIRILCWMFDESDLISCIVW
jgi:hypothetical protein